MSKFILSTLALMFTINGPLAHAKGGSMVGDGGHGVACKQGDIDHIRLLDLVEAEDLYGFNPAEDTSFSSLQALSQTKRVDAVLDAVATRFKLAVGSDFDFLAADLQAAQTLFDKNRIRTSETVFVTPDADNLKHTRRRDCRLVQLASFHETSGEWFVRLDLHFWTQLSPIDKAALLVHEVLHNSFADHSSNESVRQAVQFLFAPDDFREFNRESFIKLLVMKQPQLFTVPR